MKLKSRPEDFRVTELAEWDEDPQGDHRVYRITKTKMTTFEAVDRIRDAVGLSGEGVSYAGLKDRQAVATQHIAIKGRELRGRVDGVRHKFVGRTSRPLGSRNLRGNRFKIVIRRLLPGPAEAYREVAHETAARGLPNYFDDQRFGSIRAGQGFAGRAMLRGEFERALELLMALPGHFDPPGERARKHKIRELWGEWRVLSRELRTKKQKPLIDALARNPGDFAGALDALPTRERAVHLLAYQAYLWNECVGRLLTLLLPARTLCEAPYSVDRHIFWTAPDDGAAKSIRDSLAGLEMPLLGPRTKITDDAVGEAIAETLEAEGLTIKQFRLEGLEHAFMKEVSRPLTLTPEYFDVGEVEVDELASKGEDLRKLTLAFTLPPGAYATLVIKRVFESVAFSSAHETERSWHEVRVRDLGVLRRERAEQQAEEREARKRDRKQDKRDRRDEADRGRKPDKGAKADQRAKPDRPEKKARAEKTRSDRPAPAASEPQRGSESKSPWQNAAAPAGKPKPTREPVNPPVKATEAEPSRPASPWQSAAPAAGKPKPKPKSKSNLKPIPEPAETVHPPANATKAEPSKPATESGTTESGTTESGTTEIGTTDSKPPKAVPEPVATESAPPAPAPVASPSSPWAVAAERLVERGTLKDPSAPAGEATPTPTSTAAPTSEATAQPSASAAPSSAPPEVEPAGGSAPSAAEQAEARTPQPAGADSANAKPTPAEATATEQTPPAARRGGAWPEQPKSPKAEQPKSPVAEEPKPERPKFEQPKPPEAEKSKSERPKFEQPKHPKGDKAKPERWKAQKPKHPKGDKARPERWKAEKPKHPEGDKAKPERWKAEKPKHPKADKAKPDSWKAEKPKHPKADKAKSERPKFEKPKHPKADRADKGKTEAPGKGDKNDKAKSGKGDKAKSEKPRRPMGAARRILKKHKGEGGAEDAGHDEKFKGGKPAGKLAGKTKDADKSKKKKAKKKVRWKGLKAKRKRREDRSEDEDSGKPKKSKRRKTRSGQTRSGNPKGRGGTRKREERRSFKESKPGSKSESKSGAKPDKGGESTGKSGDGAKSGGKSSADGGGDS